VKDARSIEDFIVDEMKKRIDDEVIKALSGTTTSTISNGAEVPFTLSDLQKTFLEDHPKLFDRPVLGRIDLYGTEFLDGLVEVAKSALELTGMYKYRRVIFCPKKQEEEYYRIFLNSGFDVRLNPRYGTQYDANVEFNTNTNE
jgi:hypothetical protein